MHEHFVYAGNNAVAVGLAGEPIHFRHTVVVEVFGNEDKLAEKHRIGECHVDNARLPIAALCLLLFKFLNLGWAISARKLDDYHLIASSMMTLVEINTLHAINDRIGIMHTNTANVVLDTVAVNIALEIDFNVKLGADGMIIKKS